jgi:hypothetical protein
VSPTSDDDDGSALVDRADAVAFYRVKADLCHRMAASTTDPDLRDQWVHLANQWAHLLRHANRKATEAEDLARPFGSMRSRRES